MPEETQIIYVLTNPAMPGPVRLGKIGALYDEFPCRACRQIVKAKDMRKRRFQFQKAKEKMTDIGSSGANQVASVAGAALDWSKSAISEFQEYLESETFEKDLDELTSRLGLRGEDVPIGSTHWERCNRKARFIFAKAGTVVMASAGIVELLPPKFRKMAQVLGAGIGILVVAYHCYQVFGRAKAEAK